MPKNNMRNSSSVNKLDRNPKLRRSGRPRLLQWAVKLILLVASIVVFSVALAYFLHNQQVSLPKPSGHYSVGRKEFDWIDKDRLDPLSSQSNVYRELIVWVWYPATQDVRIQRAEYLPARWLEARQEQIGNAGNILAQNIATIQSHAYKDAPISSEESSYPVVVMQPGLGPIAGDYADLAEDLASHGYIVVASTPTYSSNVVVFHDGRVVNGNDRGNISDDMSSEQAKGKLDELVEVWAKDNQFVMNQLETLETSSSDPFNGRLNLKALGLFGHSFGGASALQTCSIDARCKASIDLDGTPYGSVVRTGISQPALFLWSGTSSDLPTAEAMNSFVKVTTGPIYQFHINGMEHFNFSDYAVEYQPVLHMMHALGPIDGKKGLEITSAFIDSFFDKELKKLPTDFPKLLLQEYPEAQAGLPTASH